MLWKPIYCRKWGTGWISPVPNESHVEASFPFYAVTLCFFSPAPSFLSSHMVAKGFKLCCPHFHTWKLREQRMKMKMQRDVRQWCCITLWNTTETHVWSQKRSVLIGAQSNAGITWSVFCVCVYTCVCMRTSNMPIVMYFNYRNWEKSKQNFLQDTFRSANQLLYDSPSVSFTSESKQKSLDVGQRCGLTSCGEKKSKWYTAILWEKHED